MNCSRPSLPPGGPQPLGGQGGAAGGCGAAPAAPGEEIPQARKLASSKGDGREAIHRGGGRACTVHGLCALLKRFCAARATPRLAGDRSRKEGERSAPCSFPWGKCFPHPKTRSSLFVFPFSGCADPIPTFFLSYVFLNFYFPPIIFCLSVCLFPGGEGSAFKFFLLLFFSFFLCMCVIFLNPFSVCSPLCVVARGSVKASVLGAGGGGAPSSMPGLPAAPNQRRSRLFFSAPCQHLTRVSVTGASKNVPFLLLVFSLLAGQRAGGLGATAESGGQLGPPPGWGKWRNASAFLPQPSRRDWLGNQQAALCGYRHGILHAILGSHFFSAALVIYTPLIYISIKYPCIYLEYVCAWRRNMYVIYSIRVYV